MIIAHTVDEMRSFTDKSRWNRKTIGFVPTMGALHDGHLSLVEMSGETCDVTVASIYVNPLQFNNPADYQTYPVTVESDLERCREAGVSCVFLPSDEMMYTDQKTSVEVRDLTEHLCGAVRPGHFTGVFTVVTKLFNIVQPDYAFFGQKDIQQARSIEKMVFDLNIPVEIVLAPIIREADGLAMSSRNRHLSADEKKRALSLFNALSLADRCIRNGERDTAVICGKMRSLVETEGQPDAVDYVSIVDYDSLQPLDVLSGKCVVALAAFFGTTRLIDNIIVSV
ncbi:MAG: pantoate--beta-alanine ligase [Spirochaetota bacterium]